VIGQRDDRTFSGVAIDDKLIAELAQIRNNTKIVPVPSITVTRHTVIGHEVAVVVVEPSSAPPVRYEGRTWIPESYAQSVLGNTATTDSPAEDSSCLGIVKHFRSLMPLAREARKPIGFQAARRADSKRDLARRPSTLDRLDLDLRARCSE
jgi:hypothetical protein